MNESSIQYNNISNTSVELNIQIQKYNKNLKAKMKKRFIRGFYYSTGWVWLNLIISIYFQHLDSISQIYALSHGNYTKRWYHVCFGVLIKLIVLIQNSIIIYSIRSKKDNSIFKLLFKYLRYPYCFLQIILSINFTFSVYYTYHSFIVWINLSLNIPTLILGYICYKKIKSQKNISLIMLITLYTYISIVASFVCYRSMYMFLFLFAYKNKFCAFLVDLMQLSFGIVLLAYYQDIFFISTSLALQSYTLAIRYSLSNMTAVYYLIGIDAFSILSIVITSIKYTNNVMGKTEGDESILYLLEYKDRMK